MDNKIEIVRSGLTCSQFCVPKSLAGDDLLRELEAQYPTGIESQWRPITRSDLKDGEPASNAERVQCAQDYGRVHIMCTC